MGTENLNHKDNSFSLIISSAVIRQLPNTLKVLVEYFRVVTSDRMLYVKTGNWQIDYTHISPFTTMSLTYTFRHTRITDVATNLGLRCKPEWYYKGKFRFPKAFYLHPFVGSAGYVQEPLNGHTQSIICIGQKP